MLTADLVRARTVKGQVRPTFVNPDDAELRERTAELVALVRQGVGEPRGELEELIDQWIGDDPQAKLLRGLWHLLERRCSFTVHAPVPPPELRVAVFRVASEKGPLAETKIDGGALTAADIYRLVGEQHGVDPALLPEALYADHPDAMRLVGLELEGEEEVAARWLLNRYNVALVQAILFGASSLTIRLARPDPPRSRQLLRAIKFHQLIHTVVPDGEDLRIVLDGPTSLFSQTSRYGLAFARFLPALLLQKGAWSLHAPVRWKEEDRVLDLDHTATLVSHYRDTGAWVPKEAVWFAERFEALNSGWELIRQPDPQRVGDIFIVPDFGFRKDGRVAWLEILGFWRKSSLSRRLEQLQQPGGENLLLAVSRRLCGEGEAQDLHGVIPFAEVIPPKDVLRRIEACAREEKC